jgi:hypothetical protein
MTNGARTTNAKGAPALATTLAASAKHSARRSFAYTPWATTRLEIGVLWVRDDGVDLWNVELATTP